MNIGTRKNVLVLGGCGFIGRNLATELSSIGWEVTVTSRLAERASAIANELGVTGRSFDLEGQCDDVSYFTGFNSVIYLVGDLVPGSSNKSLSAELALILEFCKVVESCAKAGIGRFVLVSSGGTVYGCGTPPFSESDSTNPITTYGLVKLTQEKVLSIAEVSLGLDYRVARLSNPYGPHQSAEKGQGVVSAFINRALAGFPLALFGNGDVVRDFIYIDDACRGIAALLEYEGASRIFNIGSGIGTTIGEVARLTLDCIGNQGDVEYYAPRSVDVPSNYLDATLARSELGFECDVSLPDGIRRTVEFERGSGKWDDARSN